jgi:hypothetical protein
MNPRKVILVYQFSERIKSELIIAFKMLEKMATLSGEEWSGAEKLMTSYLESLLGEIRMAQHVADSVHFRAAEDKIVKAIGHLRLFEQPDLYQCLREATSAIATSCQAAMEELEAKDLL